MGKRLTDEEKIARNKRENTKLEARIALKGALLALDADAFDSAGEKAQHAAKLCVGLVPLDIPTDEAAQ